MAPRQLLLRLYQAALRAADGRRAVRQALELDPPRGPVWLVAIGKASESMTLGALDTLGESCVGTLVVSPVEREDPRLRSGNGRHWVRGGHPIPDVSSLAAGACLLRHLAKTPPDASLLLLISGGASSLVEVPVQGVALQQLRRVNRWLLGSGLPIQSMNQVRAAVSRIKGGGLLGLLPARPLRVLAISDVPGDEAGVIGSGPLVPYPDLAQSIAHLELPLWLRCLTDLGLKGRRPHARQGPPIELVARSEDAKQGAAREALSLGLEARVHPGFLVGSAARLGGDLACLLRDGPPGLQVWGGETTVRLPKDPGLGGRNQHLALAAALEIEGRADCFILAAGTDGRDGNTEYAGALVDGGTLARGGRAGLDARDRLAKADSGRFLAASGDLVDTGPTGTNVMDLVLGLRL